MRDAAAADAGNPAPVSADVRIDAALRAIVRAAEEAWIDGLGLKERTLPPAIARMPGRIGDQAVALVTRRFDGPGLESLTLAVIATDATAATGMSGGAERLCSVTAIALPAPGSLAPILGIDVIAVRGALSLVALDLAPTDAALFDAQAAPILRDVQHGCAALTARKRPAFAGDTFSDLAVIVAARPGQEPVVAAATAQLLRASAALFSAAGAPHAPAPDPARAAAASARSLAWRRAELGNRKEHDALARIFGAEPARRYAEDFLFADPAGPASPP